jgi:hypothetical protein
MQVFMIICRKWDEQGGINGNTLPSFIDWVHGVLCVHDMEANNLDDHDLMLLCTKHGLSIVKYVKAKGSNNNFRVLDHKTNLLQIFDSSVTLVLQQLDVDARAIQLNYVGVLKDIVQLNYGLVNTPTILLRCEWIKHTNSWGSNIYIKDDARFMVVNFKHKLPVY